MTHSSEIVIARMWHDLECGTCDPALVVTSLEHLAPWLADKDPRTEALLDLVNKLVDVDARQLMDDAYARMRHAREYSDKIRRARGRIRQSGVFVRRSRVLKILLEL